MSPVPPAARRFSGTVETSAARRHQRSADAAQRWIASSGIWPLLPGGTGDVAAEGVGRAPAVQPAAEPLDALEVERRERGGVVVDELVADPAVARQQSLGEGQDLVGGPAAQPRRPRATDAAHATRRSGRTAPRSRARSRARILTVTYSTDRLINRVDDQLTITFGALADPTRRAILARLRAGRGDGERDRRAVPDHAAGRLQAPQGARAGRPDRARAQRTVAAVAPAGRDAARGGGVLRRLPALLGRQLRPALRAPRSDDRDHPRLSARRASACGRRGPSRRNSPRWWGKRGWNADLDSIVLDVRPGGAFRVTTYRRTASR